jgi:hypothetical protein
MAILALTAVADGHLELLLRRVHRGEVHCPLDVVEIARIGLQDQSEALLGTLRGLDAPAVRAVLVAALAERQAARMRAER